MMLLPLLPLFTLLTLLRFDKLLRTGSICEIGSDFTHSAVLITDDSKRLGGTAVGCGTDTSADDGGI